MIKIIFALALLSSTLFCASSAQRPQTFADEVEAAVEEFISEAVIFTKTDIESSYIIGEFDLVLTDNNHDGEDELSVHTVPASQATDLEGALTELLEKLGEAIQAKASEIESEVDGPTEGEESVTEVQQENKSTAADIRRFGYELQVYAGRMSVAVIQNYNRAAANYTNNVDHATDQLSKALNNIQKQGSKNSREAVLKLIAAIICIGNQVSDLDSKTGLILSSEINNIIESANITASESPHRSRNFHQRSSE